MGNLPLEAPFGRVWPYVAGGRAMSYDNGPAIP